MAIDPSKMEAFAQGPNPGGNADLTALKGGGGEPAGDAAPSSEDMKEGGQGKFSALIPLLEEAAEEIEACCDELDPEQLGKPEEDFDDENHDIFVESFAELPDDLKAEMLEALADGITPEEADELATHLEGEGMIEDAERFANYLQHVARAIDDGYIGAEDEEEAEAEEEVEEEEPEGGDTADAGEGQPDEEAAEE